MAATDWQALAFLVLGSWLVLAIGAAVLWVLVPPRMAGGSAVSLDTHAKPHEEANRAWNIYATKGPRDTYPADMLLELHEAHSAGFLAGARFAIATSARMSTVFVELNEFLHWLRDQ